MTQPIRPSSPDAFMPLKDSRQGWSVVVAAFVGLLISLGTLVIYSFGVLSSAMAAEFNWDSVQRGTLFAATSGAATIGGPLWGVVADRWGGRTAVMISAALLALGLLMLATVPGDIVLYHIMWGLLGLGGAGTMPPTFVSVVVGWFDRNRGLALGVSMMGVGIGAAVFPPLSAALIGEMGWRMTLVAFAGSLLVIVLPVVWFKLRAHPDAARAATSSGVGRKRLVRSAFGQRRTWILAAFAVVTGAVLVTSVSTFVPMLQARGETLAQAARYQSVLGLSLIAGRLLVGGLIDRVFAPYVMMAVLLAASAGLFLLYAADTPVAYLLAATGIGLAIGAEVDFLGYMVSRYFDRAMFATLFALLFALYALGASVMPPMIGWLAQRTGDYGAGVLLFGILMTLVALLMLALPRYAAHEAAGS